MRWFDDVKCEKVWRKSAGDDGQPAEDEKKLNLRCENEEKVESFVTNFLRNKFKKLCLKIPKSIFYLWYAGDKPLLFPINQQYLHPLH